MNKPNSRNITINVSVDVPQAGPQAPYRQLNRKKTAVKPNAQPVRPAPAKLVVGRILTTKPVVSTARPVVSRPVTVASPAAKRKATAKKIAANMLIPGFSIGKKLFRRRKR